MSLLHLIGLCMLALIVFASIVLWPWIRTKFALGDSETILLARLNMVAGAFMAVDLTPVLPAKYIPFYILGMGIIGELLRRFRATDLGTDK